VTTETKSTSRTGPRELEETHSEKVIGISRDFVSQVDAMEFLTPPGLEDELVLIFLPKHFDSSHVRSITDSTWPDRLVRFTGAPWQCERP
jgi:hypothetical protein